MRRGSIYQFAHCVRDSSVRAVSEEGRGVWGKEGERREREKKKQRVVSGSGGKTKKEKNKETPAACCARALCKSTKERIKCAPVRVCACCRRIVTDETKREGRERRECDASVKGQERVPHLEGPQGNVGVAVEHALAHVLDRIFPPVKDRGERERGGRERERERRERGRKRERKKG